MSTNTGYGEVDVEYALYVKVGPKYEPAPTEFRPILTALQLADPYRRVATSADLATASKLLHEHCVAAFYDFAAQGYRVDLAHQDDSRWDEILKDWRKLLHGAARVYPLQATGKPTLWLNARTRGSIGEPPPAADTAANAAAS
jgi:hypothetical protein